MDENRDRWEGSFGAASGGFPPQWHEHGGITRGVVEEGQQHFDTTDHFFDWFRRRNAATPLVYRDDGLVVGWNKRPGRDQLNVEVWQVYVGARLVPQPSPPVPPSDPAWPAIEGRYWPLYVGGQKPDKLSGSQNDKIIVTTVPELPKDTLSRRFFFF